MLSLVRARGLDDAAGRGVDDGGDAAGLGIERVLLGRGHGVVRWSGRLRPARGSRSRARRSTGRASRRRGAIASRAALRYGSASCVQRSITRARRAASCGLMRVELDHAVGPEHVARARRCGGTRAGLRDAEREDQAARAVRVGEREVGVLHQRLTRAKTLPSCSGARRLQREPLVDAPAARRGTARGSARSAGVGELGARRRPAPSARRGGRSC